MRPEEKNPAQPPDTTSVDTPSIADSSHVSETSSKKINPDLRVSEVKHGVRPGDVYVRMHQSHSSVSSAASVPGTLSRRRNRTSRPAFIERGYRAVKKVLVGKPLESSEEIHERLNKVKALAVFGSDAISSSAYATEASLVILMVAGNAALGISLYTWSAVGIMLSIIAFSYRQTVHAYPQGGGSYIVSRENLGQLPGLDRRSAAIS